jgi:hypothetical protein
MSHDLDIISKILFAALSAPEGNVSCEDSTGPPDVDQHHGSPTTKREIFSPYLYS